MSSWEVVPIQACLLLTFRLLDKLISLYSSSSRRAVQRPEHTYIVTGYGQGETGDHSHGYETLSSLLLRWREVCDLQTHSRTKTAIQDLTLRSQN